MDLVNLQKIVSVKGYSGLFHLTNYNPKGFFLQPIEGGSIRFFSNDKGKVFAVGNVDLKLEGDTSINLLNVFQLMEKKPMVNENTTDKNILDYFTTLIPNLDQTVPLNSLQKVVSWYSIIITLLISSKEIINEEDDGLTFA
jgi:hypothetical protein